MDGSVQGIWPRHLAEMHMVQGILDASTAYREELEFEDLMESARGSGKTPVEGRPTWVWCDCANPEAAPVDGRCPECRSHIKLCGDCAGMVRKECDCGEEEGW
jgi:hypothetical protein